jgi:hypothetical protein
MYTKEQWDRMNVLLRRILDAERAEEPSRRQVAYIQLSDIKREFPDLSQEEVGKVALDVLRTDWAVVDGPHFYGGRGLFRVGFTDEQG